MASKRDRYFAEVNRLAEHYRHLSSDYLRKQLPQMSIKEAAAAAKRVLKERDDAEENSK
jgi:hypothetical protein